MLTLRFELHLLSHATWQQMIGRCSSCDRTSITVITAAIDDAMVTIDATMATIHCCRGRRQAVHGSHTSIGIRNRTITIP